MGHLHVSVRGIKMKLSKNDEKTSKMPPLQIVIDGVQIDDAFWNSLDKESQIDIRRLLRIREKMKKKQQKKKKAMPKIKKKSMKKGVGMINGCLTYKNQQYNYTTVFSKI